ncbi:replication protein RepA4 [Escherichia coli]|nr:replication protein RepA4 [Escherichia coli]
MKELLCAVGVVPTRVYPKSGRISALAGRQGRLRACITNVPRFFPFSLRSQIVNF